MITVPLSVGVYPYRRRSGRHPFKREVKGVTCFNVKSEIPSYIYLHNHYDVSVLEGTSILSAPTSFPVKYSPKTRKVHTPDCKRTCTFENYLGVHLQEHVR